MAGRVVGGSEVHAISQDLDRAAPDPASEQDAAQTASTKSELLHPDLGRAYHEKVGQLTVAFQDDALKAQAFERLRSLTKAVVPTPEGKKLAIDLRDQLASTLTLWAGGENKKALERRVQAHHRVGRSAGSAKAANLPHRSSSPRA